MQSSAILEPSVNADGPAGPRQWSDEERAACSERPLGLGADRPVTGGPAATVRLALPDALRAAVARTALVHEVGVPAVALAALALTLARYTRAERAVVGLAASGRDTRPLLLGVREEQSGAALLTAVHEALEHPLPAAGAPPVLLEFGYDSGAGPGAEPVPSAHNDVRLVYRDRVEDGAAELIAAFPADRYTEEQLHRFTGHLRTALAVLTDAPGAPLGGACLVGKEETRRLLALGHGEELLVGSPEPVHSLVARGAAADPGRLAVVCGETRLSRGELDAWAARIASRLRAAGVGRGDRVAILAERSAAAVAAVLATVRIGAVYVPVDPAGPAERLDSVLADARPVAMVVTGELGERLTGRGLTVVTADEPGIRVGGESGDGSDRPERTDRPEPVDPGDAAYLIYTSGSTGAPKGVLVEHGQLAASTLARRLVYPGAPVFLLLSPLAFDSSAAGLWGTLTAGGRLIVAGPDEYRDPERLVGLIERHAVTHMLCVPSLYDTVLAAAERDGMAGLRSLTTVIVAGEVLPEVLLRRHTRALGDAVLVNEYGPTETTVWASYQHCDASGTADIGRPVPGARLYVLDEARRLMPRGATGELYIGGAGVSRGYFRRPDATRRVFSPDPFTGDGGRMYRTGDLVRWTEGGALEFLGRRDSQVKIRGHRIELGAVETALRACPGVREAVVVPDAGRTRLFGFVLAEYGAERDIDPVLIRGLLAAKLPEAAVPARLRVMDAFPVTSNGKADRAALAELTGAAERARPEPDGPRGGAPGDPLSQVAAAWAEVLEISEVPTTVDFFELGGHSLMILGLQGALERHTGVRPSPLDLYQCTTVETQAGLIRDGAAGPAGGASAESSADRARRARAARARRARTRQEAG
ncbi:amino acid adenylation domain-containing protein [Streptomyces jumonjinensis]|uniref:amino acid adenylation domain-containing protein n=1 Tax=Streptomyces jumonjinensis TaxID=1945 RepID=UPI0037BA4A0C